MLVFVVLSDCSNRRHGWFLALQQLLDLSQQLSVNPVYVAEDGRCLFQACLACIQSSSWTFDNLYAKALGFVRDSVPSDPDLVHYAPVFVDPVDLLSPSVLDVVPCLLSKVLDVRLRIVQMSSRGAPEVVAVLNATLSSSASEIVLFRVQNSLVRPAVDHYFGSRRLGALESVTMPAECVCLSSNPDTCLYAAYQEDDALAFFRNEITETDDHSTLNFGYAQVYAHVLLHDTGFNIDCGDFPIDKSRPCLRQQRGSFYDRQSNSVDVVGLGQNWRLAIFIEAGLSFNPTDWQRGELSRTASPDSLSSWSAMSRKACSDVKQAVLADASLLTLAATFHAKLQSFDTSLRNTGQESDNADHADQDADQDADEDADQDADQDADEDADEDADQDADQVEDDDEDDAHQVSTPIVNFVFGAILFRILPEIC